MALLDPILNPLLQLPVLWSIILLSFIIALIISVIYKFTTDQDLMKRLKGEMKEFQKEMKELKDHPEKMMEVQKKAMQTNMKYMMQSMKSTLFTFLPIIIIFGWMNAHLAYEPITPGEDFTTTVEFEEGVQGQVELSVFPGDLEIQGDAIKQIQGREVSWLLQGDKGEYQLEYKLDGEEVYKREVLITDKHEYKDPVKNIKDDNVKTISIDNEKMKVLNLFGWKLGWLGTYIIFSIIFSMVLRKLMRLY